MAGARLKDVAERAGVSIKTVSNVARGSAKVAAGTRERVQRAIEELGYTPNASARHLRTGRSGIIALAVPELLSPYFAELATEVIAAAKKRGCTVLIEATGGDPDEELRIACGLSDPLIDGVLLSPLSLDQSVLAERVRRVPLVLLGEREYDVPADHVLIDNIRAAREATEYLLGLDRSRIAVIGRQTTPPQVTAQQRMRGYLDALEAAGVPFEEELAPPVAHFHRADGAEAMRQLLALDEPPQAVFCFTDLLASGAIRAAHEAGLAVPRDLAVVGFDDIQETRFTVPSLTTIAPDKGEIARIAVDALLARIEGEAEAPPNTLLAAYELRVRESTQG